MQDLTARQQEIFDFIRGWQREHGYAPAIREIAAFFKINVTSTANHLKALEHKGVLRREPGKRRSLTFAGTVEDSNDELLHLTPDWFGKGSMIAVRVMGDSMEGDAIRDGDIAIINLQQRTASPRDIVAVRVDGAEVTLKRVRIHKGQGELVPSNPSHKIRRVPAETLEILGVLEGIVRKSRG